MYCPNCAASVKDTQKYCRSCGFDLNIVSQAFNTEFRAIEATESELPRGRKEKLQLDGKIALMFGLMIGCLIPISLGLFPNWAGLNSLILILSGLSGLFLFGGVILVVYSDSLRDIKRGYAPPLPQAATTNQLEPPRQYESALSVTERTTDLLNATPVESPRDSL